MKNLIMVAVLLMPTTLHADEILQTFEGSNNHTTRPFEVSGPWEIQWDADGQLFQIFLYEGGGNLAGVPANQAGSGSGSAYHPNGGRYYLQMNGIGEWRVKIVSVE